MTKPPLSSPAREYRVRSVWSSLKGSGSAYEDMIGITHLHKTSYSGSDMIRVIVHSDHHLDANFFMLPFQMHKSICNFKIFLPAIKKISGFLLNQKIRF